MTTAEKFKKLGNAIKRYRGRFHPKSGKWVTPPEYKAQADVLRWLDRLGIPADAVNTIDGFKTFPEYRNWMSAQQAAQTELHEARLYE